MAAPTRASEKEGPPGNNATHNGLPDLGCIRIRTLLPSQILGCMPLTVTVVSEADMRRRARSKVRSRLRNRRFPARQSFGSISEAAQQRNQSIAIGPTERRRGHRRRFGRQGVHLANEFAAEGGQ